MLLQARVGAAYLRGLLRLGGVAFPAVAHCDLDMADRMAGWLARAARRHGPILITLTTSAAVRVARAATASGLDLSRVTFAPRSEALTEARRRNIEASGARAFGDYGSREMMSVAVSCPNGVAADDFHVYSNRHALIRHRRELLAGGPAVDAMLFTSLTDAAAKILLNAEMGDYAEVEQREGACCALGELGLTTHISNVLSFEKLTGEGVTVPGSSLLRVLEEVLPDRFGGSSVDYQLVETEDESSLTRVVLRAHPRLGPIDEAAARQALLAELDHGNVIDQNIARIWKRAGTIEVRREPPLATRAGKVLPFHLERHLGERR